jgi:putative ABC transport system permease protein
MMLWRRLVYLLPWRRRAAEEEIQNEIRAIAEMAKPGELGNLTIAAEDARAELGWTRLEQIGQDLRYAARTLRRAPAFTITAILSLAIGIGANSALFSLINTTLWKSLPVHDAETLLALGRQDETGVSHGFTYGHYQLFREHVPGLALAGYAIAPLNVSIDGQIEPTLLGNLVTGAYFPLLGLAPARGRLIGPEDDGVPMGHPVAVLSYDYWRRRFNADQGVVGRTLAISGHPFTIVGIAPAGFSGAEVGAAPHLFLPVLMQPVVMPMTANLIARDTNVFSAWLRILARTTPGVTSGQARAQLDVLAGAPDTDWRPRNKFTGQVEDQRLVLVSAAAGLSDLRRQLSQPLFLLLGVSGLVLIIACANVGNLVLARSATRRPEFALRLALGAGRGRLIRQVLAEGLVLAGLAGIAALVLAWWTAYALVAYASTGRGAIVLDLSPDLRVFAFTAAISVLSGVLLACLPALRASRADRWADGGVELSRVRAIGHAAGPGRTLVVVQIALSLVLLVGAGLFARTLQNLNRQDEAVDRRRVVVVRIEPRGSGNRGTPGMATRLDATYRQLIAQVEALPGVRAASLARSSPLGQTGYGYRIVRPSAVQPELLTASIVYPRYFETMGMPIVVGRDFNDQDLRPGSPPAVIVNEAFVRTVLGGAAPLGTGHGVSVAIGRGSQRGAPMNIIGVVRDSRLPALREAARPIVYQTFLQASTGFGGMTLHVRMSEAGEISTRQLRAAVQAVQPDVPMSQIHTFADEVDAALVRERLVATLSGAFAFVALTLISVGLYGLMAFSVARRTPEIGVRIALGATPSAVRGLVVREAFRVLAIGFVVGVPAAWIAGRLASRQLSSLLFGLTPGDPVSFVLAAALLALVTVVAGVLPAVRASRVDPIAALRQD